MLLVLAFVLRIPSFYGEYVTNDSAIYLNAAERIVDGGVQYVDTWENKPPLTVWVYTLFVWLFGEGASLAIAIFTCVYIFVAALLFNQLFFEFRLLRKFSLLPGGLLVFFLCSPWYIQELNTELLCLLPMIIAIRLMAKHFVDEDPSKSMRLFWAGLMVALCMGFRYHGVFFLAAILLAYIIVARFRGQEFVTLLGGVLTGLAVMLFFIISTGAWSAFWEIGLIYNLDYIRQSGNPGETNGWGNLIENFKLWGGLLFVAVLGFFSLRIHYNKMTVNQRKVETLLLIWLIFSVITLFLGGRFYLHYFYFALPAIMVYVVYALRVRLRGMWRGLAFILIVAFPLFTTASFFCGQLARAPRQHQSPDAGHLGRRLGRRPVLPAAPHAHRASHPARPRPAQD